MNTKMTAGDMRANKELKEAAQRWFSVQKPLLF